ncbi:MAG: hypothetical protein KBS59_00895 [Clostridiales bacterium]|nr:hypothetical protein [Clostridiales bacterium]
MPIYYIDSLAGDNKNSGLSENEPLENIDGLSLCDNDEVRFRRGTEYRGGISYHGKDGEHVKFCAYGEGENPKFYGSINRSEMYLWKETEKNVWLLQIKLTSPACNAVFDFGDHCGIKATSADALDAQGKWYYDGADFYIYSEENPGKYYSDIEICLSDMNSAVISVDGNATVENLDVVCAGGNGISSRNAENLIISECRFEFIGGAESDADANLRYGSAVSITGARGKVNVENCYFYNIFDSCISVESFDEKSSPKMNFSGNTMNKYGMAALETSGNVRGDVLFELNECMGAGRGFSLGGGKPPRMSKIYPEPTGYHVLASDCAFARGKITARRNVFRGVPTGADVRLIGSCENPGNVIVSENSEKQ